jgi:uncharacterized protein YdeI (YjbR/CyaY-like superfamily)
MNKIKTVDEYIDRAEKKWKPLLTNLRKIILKSKLEESIKWKLLVYSLNGKHVLGLGAFKSFVSIWFFQGVFLKDKKQKLVNAQEGVTKALRQWRFTHEDELDEKLITAYVEEAIANQEKGMAIKPTRKKKAEIPVMLKQAFNQYPAAKKAFEKFSVAKQNEYAEYISEAKLDETKQKRINKIIPMIVELRGLNDHYS